MQRRTGSWCEASLGEFGGAQEGTAPRGGESAVEHRWDLPLAVVQTPGGEAGGEDQRAGAVQVLRALGVVVRERLSTGEREGDAGGGAARAAEEGKREEIAPGEGGMEVSPPPPTPPLVLSGHAASLTPY